VNVNLGKVNEIGGDKLGEEAKPPHRATAGFIVSLIGGILILVNALLVVGVAGTVGAFAAWLPEAEEAAGVVSAFFMAWAAAGMIFAILVVIGAVLIYMPGREVIGGILVLIFSILSIIIGGGFFVGMILGIVGGALGIAKK